MFLRSGFRSGLAGPPRGLHFLPGLTWDRALFLVPFLPPHSLPGQDSQREIGGSSREGSGRTSAFLPLRRARPAPPASPPPQNRLPPFLKPRQRSCSRLSHP